LNKYIREYKIKNDEDLLFKTKSWWILTKSTLEYLVNLYKQKAKLNNFHFHMLKHSIAVHLLELWLSIFELKNYLGHKSINSTMVYASFSSQMNKEVYNKINKVWLV
jgi:site-specific recombinase XerD